MRHALLALVLAGCSAPPAAPLVVLLPPAVAATAEPIAGPPEPTPPGLEMPGEQGCIFPTSEHLELRFQAGAPPFATLQGASALVFLSTAGPAAGASARVVHEGFTLTGIVDGDDVSLSPTRATVMGGFLIPTSDARLAWKGTAPGRITVELVPSLRIEALPEAHLGAMTLACDEVDLDHHGSFDAFAAAPHSPKQRNARLRSGVPIPLSRTPGGPAVATFEAESDDEAITLVETRGRHALVVRPHREVVLFGWIPRTAVLLVASTGIGDNYSNGPGLTDTRKSRVHAVVHCDHDLPLVALVAGERRTVGSVAAGTPLRLADARLGDPRGVIAPLVLPDTLAVAEAWLGVLASQVAACQQRR